MPVQRMGKILETKIPYRLQTSLVFDSPHSGREYPSNFGHSCPFTPLRQAEDAWLDNLLENLMTELDVPFLHALFPRSYIDLNRADDVTPRAMQKGADLNVEYKLKQSGLIRKNITSRDMRPIYDRKISLREAFHRVADYYKPYHTVLGNLIDKTHKVRGRVVHLNMHSMPSMLRAGTVKNPYHFILGTLGGKTTDAAYTQKLKELLEARGYKVGVNVKGFSGREIVSRHSDPKNHRHSIQIEINRRLYIQEHSLALGAGWGVLKDELRIVMKDFQKFVDDQPPPPKATPLAKPRLK